jgi:hypothetical protein
MEYAPEENYRLPEKKEEEKVRRERGRAGAEGRRRTPFNG